MPCCYEQASRTFAQERKEGSSTSNWGTGEPPIDESTTQRGVAPGSQESQQLQDKRPSPATDSEGQTPTPNLSRQKSTRDFINSKREERMHAAQVKDRRTQTWQVSVISPSVWVA